MHSLILRASWPWFCYSGASMEEEDKTCNSSHGLDSDPKGSSSSSNVDTSLKIRTPEIKSTDEAGGALVLRERGEAIPETGNQRLGDIKSLRADQEKTANDASVSCVEPNIPNVFEYHLKVKSHTRKDTLNNNQVPSSITSKAMKQQPQHIPPLFSKSLTPEQRKELCNRLSKLSVDSNVFEGSSDLPQVFQVKYLGSHDARGLWGIKNIRKPVDNMVDAAKSLPTGTILPFIKLAISEDGVAFLPLGRRKTSSDSSTGATVAAAPSRLYPIETISYGVQDLVYTRVFSMIVVRETEDFRRMSPFECHAFVCESKHHARQMTYALAAAFQIYSQHVKDRCGGDDKRPASCHKWPKGFALELRNPNEIETDYTLSPEE